MIIIYIGSVYVILIAFIFVDSWINVLCVFCSFEANQAWFRCLCDCGGSKRLKCAFCFCCFCCNDSAQMEAARDSQDSQDMEVAVSTNSKR